MCIHALSFTHECVFSVLMAAVFQEKTLAVLGGDRCHCGFPTSLFSLHEPEDESLCLHHCLGEEFETCGNEEYFVVYQTQVQGNIWWLKGLYKGPIGQRYMSGCIIN